MDDACLICALPISEMDRLSGRVTRYKHSEAHSYCRVIEAGVVPDCPLADSISPKPCTGLCVQAQACTSAECCGCRCENLLCQIGQSVRALRSQGLINWRGYVPLELRRQTLRETKLDGPELDAHGRKNINWPGVYKYLASLSSHGTYVPHSVASNLEACGLQVKVLPNDAGLQIYDRIIPVSEPDYGAPGIWSLTLAYKLYSIATGNNYVSPFAGRGYQYRDVLEQFGMFIESNKCNGDA